MKANSTTRPNSIRIGKKEIRLVKNIETITENDNISYSYDELIIDKPTFISYFLSLSTEDIPLEEKDIPFTTGELFDSLYLHFQEIETNKLIDKIKEYYSKNVIDDNTLNTYVEKGIIPNLEVVQNDTN